MNIDLAALRAVKACGPCRGAYNLPMRALDRVVECDSCLRLIVAAVLEQAARIAEGLRPGDDSTLATRDPSMLKVAAEIRRAAKEGQTS